jgi:hypothetical protein
MECKIIGNKLQLTVPLRPLWKGATGPRFVVASSYGPKDTGLNHQKCPLFVNLKAVVKMR